MQRNKRKEVKHCSKRELKNNSNSKRNKYRTKESRRHKRNIDRQTSIKKTTKNKSKRWRLANVEITIEKFKKITFSKNLIITIFFFLNSLCKRLEAFLKSEKKYRMFFVLLYTRTFYGKLIESPSVLFKIPWIAISNANWNQVNA